MVLCKFWLGMWVKFGTGRTNEDWEKIVSKNLSPHVDLKLLKLFHYLNVLIVAPNNCDVFLQSIKHLPAQVIR